MDYGTGGFKNDFLVINMFSIHIITFFKSISTAFRLTNSKETQADKCQSAAEIINLTSLAVYTKVENGELVRKKICVSILCAKADKNVHNDIFFGEDQTLRLVEEDGVDWRKRALVKIVDNCSAENKSQFVINHLKHQTPRTLFFKQPGHSKSKIDGLHQE